MDISFKIFCRHSSVINKIITDDLKGDKFIILFRFTADSTVLQSLVPSTKRVEPLDAINYCKL